MRDCRLGTLCMTRGRTGNWIRPFLERPTESEILSWDCDESIRNCLGNVRLFLFINCCTDSCQGCRCPVLSKYMIAKFHHRWANTGPELHGCAHQMMQMQVIYNGGQNPGNQSGRHRTECPVFHGHSVQRKFQEQFCINVLCNIDYQH